MRILLVTHAFPRSPDDGAGNFLLSLAAGQIARGHHVAVVAPHGPGLALKEMVAGVEVRRYRYGEDSQETLAYTGTMHAQVFASWAARWRFIGLLRALRHEVGRAIADWRPDVVHVHWWIPNGATLWPLMSTPRHVARVLTSHGTDLFLLDRKPIFRHAARAVFRRAERVTVISSPLVERVLRLGVSRDRITVVPMPIVAVDEPGAHARPGDGLILGVGRLIERKGFATLLRALPLVRLKLPTARVVLVGDGPERRSLECLALELGVAAAVRFDGQLPSPEVRRAYRSADAFCLPAITDARGEQEGFGMVFAEAMHAGLPVVTTRSGGITDVVRDSETGLLVPEGNPSLLAEALVRVLTDRPLAARLQAGGRALLASTLSPGAIAATFSRVYDEAIADRRGADPSILPA